MMMMVRVLMMVRMMYDGHCCRRHCVHIVRARLSKRLPLVLEPVNCFVMKDCPAYNFEQHPRRRKNESK